MKGHAPRHRAVGPTTKVLRKVRWLRVMHPQQSTTVALQLDVACRVATPNEK